MSDPDINELEALTALIESDGWTLLMAHLEKEWGATAYALKMDTAITTAKNNRESAEQDICELGAAVRAVRVFAQYPKTRLAQIKAERQKTTTGMFAGLRRG